MNFNRIISLITLIFLGITVFCQDAILIKNNPDIQIIINSDYSNSLGDDLKLEFEKLDSVVIEIKKDGFSFKKEILLGDSKSYQVIKTTQGQYKLRLRSNLELANPIEILLDTLRPKRIVSRTILIELEKQEFEFGKVNLLITHLRETKETNESLSKYLLALRHDFSKWQVIEVVLSEKLMTLDYSIVSKTFDSETYKGWLKTKLK